MTDATVTDAMGTAGTTASVGAAASVVAALAELADPARAEGASRYFQGGPGQYGEGDVFLGVSVPATRQVVKRFTGLPLAEIDLLLASPVHEHRLAALLILVARFERAGTTRHRDDDARAAIAGFYLDAVRRGRVNNWDLVDSSAPAVLGGYLFDRPRGVLFELAGNELLWQRRTAMIATLGFIARGDASTTLELSALLLDDTESLIHKAVGWMLREVGKRVDRALLLAFLDENAGRMPRTALSYATEHLDAGLRAHYRALPRPTDRT
ncbi:DNA alkylation repair protein [Cryobacterium sp. HLT2-28]|uniref:DNA alkylation repair protein n=1 Tax=Cryobacterium sp. HLT2-28 TaxID=1259146 RepID=UPI001A7E5063|nr:DNA alkylation repair protein [Cryobacterium sp. HLT2-28]